jgi:drug/metabolite transporter (DMT)-like permease
MKNNRLLGLISGLSAASIWGGMYVVSKVVLEVIPPFSLLAMRLILGAATLGGVLLFSRRSRLTPRQMRDSFLVGMVGYGISLGFQFVGTKLSTASNGALVTSATPAFVLLFAPRLLGEKATWRGVLALAVSTLGVLAVIDPRTADLSSSLFVGNLCLLAAALTWALYSVLVRKVAQSADLVASSAIMLAGGLPTSMLLGALETNRPALLEITAGLWGGILFLGIISTALAMFLWNYAFATLPAAAASLTFFAQPLVGALLGWFFLGETITPMFLLGGLLIGAGLIISNENQP